MQIDNRGTNDKNEKIRPKGVVKGSIDLFLKFWDPAISFERFEIETSNLACRLSPGGTTEK